jgi:hypothetical protein
MRKDTALQYTVTKQKFKISDLLNKTVAHTWLTGSDKTIQFSWLGENEDSTAVYFDNLCV